MNPSADKILTSVMQEVVFTFKKKRERDKKKKKREKKKETTPEAAFKRPG